jgi:hypothetical protein
MTAIVIKGPPYDKWQDAQDIANSGRAFIYIHSNGSKWAGQQPDDVADLLCVLDQYELVDDYAYHMIDVCAGVTNPKWCNGEVYGVMVWVFTRETVEDAWELDEESRDSECWGYIGGTYAEETLKEQFDSEVNA